MAFTELNSDEYFFIKKFADVNLNEDTLIELAERYAGAWQYKSGSDLKRGVNEVSQKRKVKHLLA